MGPANWATRSLCKLALSLCQLPGFFFFTPSCPLVVLRTLALIVYAHRSLLCTQFMSQCHVTSCTSACTKEEIYSHERIVSIALTLLRFSSLGWSVTPTLFWIDDFLKIILDRLRKSEQKINVESLKFSLFFAHPKQSQWPLNFFAFLTKVSHNLAAKKVLQENQYWKILVQTSTAFELVLVMDLHSLP